MVMKKSKSQRIPKDATVEDIVAFADSIGCIVEFEFKPRAAQLLRAPDAPEQKRGDEEQKQIQCPVCGNWVWLYNGYIVESHTMNGRVDSPYCKQSSERYAPVSKRSERR